MKKYIFGIATLVSFAACKNNSTETEPKRDTVVVMQPAPPQKTVVIERSAPRRSSASGTAASQPAGVNANTAPVVQTVPVPQTEQKKKGWSDAAKGTAIGGVAGGVAGVLIDSKDGNRTEGALIGTALGAGAGYIIGRAKDRKTGRVKVDSSQ